MPVGQNDDAPYAPPAAAHSRLRRRATPSLTGTAKGMMRSALGEAGRVVVSRR
jgi:hypothetical protein